VEKSAKGLQREPTTKKLSTTEPILVTRKKRGDGQKKGEIGQNLKEEWPKPATEGMRIPSGGLGEGLRVEG